MVTTGSDAPDFTLPGLDGLTYALHEARNAGPVLLFWQAHCGACKMVAPYLTRLHESYENPGWTFWTIAQDGPDDARAFVQERAVRPTVLVDGPHLRVDADPAIDAVVLLHRAGVRRDAGGRWVRQGAAQ